jgi:predicted alpha/beta hydrolase family esterase
MIKRVFVVHGWDGSPEEGWFPWLKRELEAKGFEVHVPQLPDAANPRIYNWVPALAHAVGMPDEQTYFVGHSMGCQTIARYLETLPNGVQVGGAVFVGGYFKSLVLAEDEEEEVWNSWKSVPVDLSKVGSHLPKSVAIFSDDDPYVPLDNQDDFRDKLGSEIVVEHAKGHYTGGDDKCFELPTVLQKFLKISQN